jgi:hypothetical protein
MTISAPFLIKLLITRHNLFIITLLEIQQGKGTTPPSEGRLLIFSTIEDLLISSATFEVSEAHMQQP